MLVQSTPPLHLTYCLNIHPGESWAENFEAIRAHSLRVRDRMANGKPFGLGLRLSAAAAGELGEPGALKEFREFLRRENLYVFTINGFPYGRFHGTAVKEDVYRPDWQDARRRDYTIRLADILAALLPDGVSGSISTVPGSYKAWITSPGQVEAMACMLADVAAHLAGIRSRTGRDICLALEPEPDCYIETTAEAVAFFGGPLLEHGRRRLSEDCLRRHVGLCLDTAHAAVEFEDLSASLRQLREAGVRVAKVQLSAALRLAPTPEALRRLEEFRDAVYLHQVKARGSDGAIRSYRDLPEAMSAQSETGDSPHFPKRKKGTVPAAPVPAAPSELRVHFHVPLYCEPAAPLASTAGLMTEEFWRLLREGATSHAEIETYTFGVLPGALRAKDVTESICREYEWVLEKSRQLHFPPRKM
jgi:sugar phosphate isomerase/epimerase